VNFNFESVNFVMNVVDVMRWICISKMQRDGY